MKGGESSTMDKSVAAVHGTAADAERASSLDDTVDQLGTKLDCQDMYRLGKTQQLKRNFRLFSIFGFIMVLMATWEAQLSANIFGLVNGGTGGLIWMYIGTFCGFLCCVISMAEMASMAPTSGGQYHWVSEFAPANAQRFLSYLVGWLCVLGWQVGTVAIAFLAASMIQGLIILNNDWYEPQRWHVTLLIIAIITFCQIFNTFFYRQLPAVETLALVLHIVGFFAVLIPLWVMGPRGDPYTVFFTFTDGGGWGNVGLSCLVGILSPIFSLLGPDSAVHMAEELRNASKSLPRAMIATMLINGSMGFVMIVTFCFVLGDEASVLQTQTTQPFIQVFFNAVQNKAGASAMTAILIVMTMCGCLNNIATSSRQLWAFARDRGVPFSSWFAVVHPKIGLPLNALLFSFICSILLSLINIGSNAGLNIVTSLGVGALISSYMISIGCMALKRLRKEALLPASFRLGRAGLPLNVISVLFLLFNFIMSFFPGSPNPTADGMNYNIAVYSGVVVFSVLYYILWGRKAYTGPVRYVRKSA